MSRASSLGTILCAGLLWATPALAQIMSTEMSPPLPENSSTLRVGQPEYDAQKRFSGKWEAEMGLEGRDQGVDQGFASHFGARSQLDFKLTPMLAIRATPAADYYTSRMQTRFENDDYSSQLSVDDSYLQF